MLEERLSSTYSQQPFGYGAAPGMPHYPSMQGMAPPSNDIKSGAESFYYGNAPDPSATGYAPPPMNGNAYNVPVGGVTNSAYGAQAQRGPPLNESHNPTWNQNPYPSLGSPPPTGALASNHTGPTGPAAYYTAPLPDQDPAKAQYSEVPYQPSPIMRRDSQYQPSAPPGAPAPSLPEPHSPEHMQSPAYSTMGPTLHQQPTDPSPQSYYYPPQQHHPSSEYPPMTTGQPGAFPDAPQTQLAQTHQPPKPVVEESLIEL